MKFRKDFAGMDGLHWWTGVVENRQDPLGLGRCQVRIFGLHTESLSDIPSEDLFWAHPVHSLNNQTFSTPKEGDYVFGFFFDGRHGQSPVMLGIIPGIPQERFVPTSGFGDVRELSEIANAPKKPVGLVYGKDGSGITVLEANTSNTEVLQSLRYPKESDLRHPTNSNLARAENLETTLLEDKKNNTLTVTSAGGGKWDEPPPAYGADYPYNKVLETESGHIMEFDDTPGAERIHIAHRTGSFQEYYPSGSKVEKIVKNNYKLVLSDDNIYVTGKVNITIESDANIRVVGDVNLQAENDLNIGVAGDGNVSIGGKLQVKAKDGIVFESESGVDIKAADDAKLESGSSVHILASDPVLIDGSDVMVSLGMATEAGSASVTAPPPIGVPTAAPFFIENSPRVILDEILEYQNQTRIDDYLKNPDKYKNPIAADGDVKENYPGTPDTGTAGQSLIVNTPVASDLCAFLAEQLRLTAANGYWAETGMGGAPSNPNILRIWSSLGIGNRGYWGTDQTPWCMGFVNYALKTCGYRFVQTARAFDIRDRLKAYKAIPITDFKQAQCGDIALWSYSHVNFVFSNNNGRLTFVGGNQSTKGRANNNNPSKGDVTKSWAGGYSPPGNGTLIGIYRPVKV